MFQHNHYYVRIARFMPRVEIVQKHNTAARRLYIRGQNGKVSNMLVADKKKKKLFLLIFLLDSIYFFTWVHF